MKLISLNCWGGIKFEPLMKFLKEESKDTDIFLFQEVFDSNILGDVGDYGRSNLFNEIKSALSDYEAFFYPAMKNWGFCKKADFDVGYGLAIFVRKGVNFMEEGDFFVYGEPYHKFEKGKVPPRNASYIKIKNKEKDFLILNFHGIWNGKGKGDSEDRILQSNNIKNFINGRNEEIVLCGDFNLLPETESLRILEENMRNLIKENNIKSTRSDFYKKPEKYADYALISKGVNVHRFEVPYKEVSDHLPMILEFD